MEEKPEPHEHLWVGQSGEPEDEYRLVCVWCGLRKVLPKGKLVDQGAQKGVDW